MLKPMFSEIFRREASSKVPEEYSAEIISIKVQFREIVTLFEKAMW